MKADRIFLGGVVVLIVGALAGSWQYLHREIREPSKPEPPQEVADFAPRQGTEAPVVAKIIEWVEDPVVGSFSVLQVLDPKSVEVRTVLCLRRGPDIVGKFRVTDVAPEGTVANPITTFDVVKPRVGDELILDRWSSR